MKKRTLIVVFGITLGIPVILNYILLCPSPLCNIIGENEAPNVWLNFWANYSGAVISALVSFFILNKTLAQNHAENEMNRISDDKQFVIEQKKDDLNLLIENLIAYVSCFNPNNFRNIYNRCRRSKENRMASIDGIGTLNNEAFIDDIGTLYNEAFIALERVSLLFDSKELDSDNLKWLSQDYLLLLSFLHDFQEFIADENVWDNIENSKRQFDALLYSYSRIKIEIIEPKARKLVDEKRKEIESILQN